MPRHVQLGNGVVVPYPEPTSPSRSNVGRSNLRCNTKPEIALRSELHRRGLRFRRDFFIRLDTVRVHVDIAFTRKRLAVFVDGCFWHSCPEHGTTPKSNTAYWKPKLESNRARDLRVDTALREAGWTVLRVWEHEPLLVSVDQVVTCLASLKI